MVSPHRPVTELDKSDVLSGLFASWDALDRLTTGLTDEQWQLPTPLPGWNVHAVVSHIIGTESVLQGIATPAPDVDVSALEHVRNDSGAMNECWVRQLSGIPGAELRERFLAVTKDRRELLTDMSEGDWNAVTRTPAGSDSYGRFMRIRVFDTWMHEHDVRDAIGRPAADAELSGPDSRLAIDEMAASMGYVVGKLGKAPDGSRIVLELTGPLARTIHVVVDGRGQVVNDFGGREPTSTIRLDGLLFTRLAGGRVTAAPAEAVELGGDLDVADRVVA
ncbi:MAG: maleylpyruvate isomerase family mycothiol-dependent enzyme, partial [Mycobacterium sp.]|nr:maleylpyruvate isomerase family mycothiol-dependent enzyme [Mycobacterium sp.]